MAKLILLVDGVGAQHFELKGETLRIGRGTNNDVHIDDLSVSSEHAIIEKNYDENFPDHVSYTIRDLGSTNNTYINDIQVSTAQLNNNDVLKVGWRIFKFVDETQPAMDTTAYILPT